MCVGASDRYDGRTASRFSDGRQGHIPLLLHPDPKGALFLGLGTGATFAAAADHPGLEADGVELVPEIITVLPYFQKATGSIDKFSQLHIHQKANTDDERDVHERLRDYWTARDIFLHAGAGVRQTPSVELMLRQVRKLLLDIVRQSPDFEPAYTSLLAIARQLHRSNPDAARRLLIDLEAANTNRQDARRLREYLYN